MEVLLEVNRVVRYTSGLDMPMSGFGEWYLVILSLAILQTRSRCQIGTPTQDKPQGQREDTDIFHAAYRTPLIPNIQPRYRKLEEHGRCLRVARVYIV